MTVREFLAKRQKHGYMFAHALTTLGLYVCSVKRRVHPMTNRVEYSGRVCLDNNDAGKADYARWQLNGLAIEHNYGNLSMDTVGL